MRTHRILRVEVRHSRFLSGRINFLLSFAGLGCILIRRKVLEAIDFRMVDQNGGHCDSWFTDDAYHAGYTQMADMSVICAHKDEHGDILWPRMPDKAGVWERRDHGT